MNIELFLIGFIAALTPGPDILLTIQTTLNHSFKEGLKVVSGILTGNIVMILILLVGLSSVGKSAPFQMFISLFGGFYLLYVAFEIFRHRKEQVRAAQTKAKTFYFKGLTVNLSNPKAIIFFSAILAPFLDKGSLALNLLSLFLGILLAFLTATFLTEFFRKNLLNPKVSAAINTISSIIFFLFSIELFRNFYSIAADFFSLLKS
ncbi:LysE family translocator [Hippea alviniae]|uniref:LysE family translocator n=1 Tax=Hippea alviniae TaxID=1279027 RepID=UPI0003B31429|nr:LysE family translocator [Hippea alviniae]